MKLTYKVTKETEYKTVKEVLKIEFQMSDRLLLKLKKLQKITLNGEVVYVHHIIQEGDIIECDLNYEEDNSNVIPSSMPLSILYEDDSFLVIDKPAGIPVHPSMEHYTDSLSNGIRFYFDQIGLHKKIRPVNRLDKDTSGIVIFAKNEYVQECLVKQMKSNQFVKKYIAIVEGHLENKEGTINSPIARKESSIIERCISENGEKAITHYKVLSADEISIIFKESFSTKETQKTKQSSNKLEDLELIECTLETGKTHQIRVHFASISHPLLGDTLYGNSSPIINRQALHCYYMSFIHPITYKKVSYKSELPEDMKYIITNEKR